jgi:hypothetical protein
MELIVGTLVLEFNAHSTLSLAFDWTAQAILLMLKSVLEHDSFRFALETTLDNFG